MKMALLAAVTTLIGPPPGGQTLTATPAESAAYERVQAYLDATGRLVDAVRNRDPAGFSRLVAPGTTMLQDGRNQPFALTSLAGLVDRCRAAQSVRLGIDDEVTLYWTCPGDHGPALQTLFKYRGGRVAWAATERAVVYTLPAPPAR
jgi:hypothetical protein